MFDTRINQGINYGFFGAIKDLPEGWRLFSGYISKITEVLQRIKSSLVLGCHEFTCKHLIKWFIEGGLNVW